MVYFLKNCENTYCIEVRLKFSYPISSFRKGSHNRNTIPLEGSIPQQQHLFLINGNVASVGRKKSRVYFLLAMMYMRAERKILPGLSFPDLCHKVYNFQCGSHIGLCLSPFIFLGKIIKWHRNIFMSLLLKKWLPTKVSATIKLCRSICFSNSL